MNDAPKAASHRSNRLLAALAPEDFARLSPHLEVVSLPKGRIIYEPGETIRHTYFPHNTIVSLVALLRNGESAEVAIFGKEAAFGFASALVSRKAYGRYVTQFSGTASRIGTELLLQAARERPRIQHLLHCLIEILMAQTLQTVACNAAHSVTARCSRWILSTRDRMGQDTLPLTHEILADMLGVQRSTVSSAMRSLQMSGLICQSRGMITILDPCGLEESACECYGIIGNVFDTLLPGTLKGA